MGSNSIGPAILIYFRNSDGVLHREGPQYNLEFFGGVLPSAGDLILCDSVLDGLDRRKPSSRKMWEVVQRLFNIHDLGGAVVGLVVEERPMTLNEANILPD
ncbi:hypothetical protein V5F31_06040 [Xanthobacter sp. V7C-4]|uniref:hypothetical protein n=1 Tax=Xanthobacter autotrophicus (strain ATCC BAA-1158 / Py2) TaxID=78245 RepID=UPI003728E5E2